MTTWFKRLIPCIRNKQLNTSLPDNDKSSKLLIQIAHEKEPQQVKENIELLEKDSEVELFSEILNEYNIIKPSPGRQLDKEETQLEVGGEGAELKVAAAAAAGVHEKTSETFISCTLHQSLSDFSQVKITHANLKSRASVTNKEKPRNTLVFKTVMVNGEPCTTRYKTAEISAPKKNCPDELDLKLGEEIKGSDIKLVFSHDVLEYLTKSFIHNKDNDLNRHKTEANDLVVCTLFPQQSRDHQTTEIDMEVDTNSCGTNDNSESDNVTNDMDIDDINSYRENNESMVHSDNYVFMKGQNAQRSEYKLSCTTGKGFQTSLSKSSPHMQQQESTNMVNLREMPRLRRNISKKVSWKENVEVCFFNHSSKSANEILQETQPLIDHEVYWKECVCEMDRKRREKWLKIRADEQRCLTGDGQFHDYFTYRSHHYDEEDIRVMD